MKIFTKFTEYINYQVRNMNMSCIKKSNSLTLEEVHKKYVDTMRFTHNNVNFNVTYDGHQSPSKCSQKVFLTNFDDLHIWCQNWYQYVRTSLCHFIFRWFKFRLKPPYTIGHGHLFGNLGHFPLDFFCQIWTQHSLRHLLWHLMTSFEICQLLVTPGPFEYFWQNQKINFFSMKEWQGFNEAWGF